MDVGRRAYRRFMVVMSVLVGTLLGMAGAAAATVTVDIGAIHDQNWDLSEGIAAVGAVALALAGLFIVIKIVKSVFAAIV